MTFEDHLWQTASAGSPSYSAREDRALIAQLWDEGVIYGMKVVERGAGANMSVDINIGDAVIQGDDQARQGNYLCQCTALENKTVTAAPGSNSRLDLVVVEVLDPDSGGAAGRITQFRVIAGTAAASPVLPALPPTAIPLAQLGPITTSTTSITNSLITDLRVPAGERVSAGTIKMRAGQRVPSGWLACNGTAVSRTTYARLFDEIGTLYGVGDGSTTFNLPNGLGRMFWPQWAGEATIDTINEQGGEFRHALTEAELAVHDHPDTLAAPAHVHDIDHNHPAAASSQTFLAGPGGGSQTGTSGGTTFFTSTVSIDLPNFTGTSGPASATALTGAVGDAGSGTAHNTMPPYTVVPVYIIRT